MSLSEALGSYPVVHHFYPIDPETASQQQSAVYNAPAYPLVAPIIPAPSKQPPERRAKKSKRNREKHDVEDGFSDIDTPSGQLHRANAGKRRRCRDSSEASEPSGNRRNPQRRRRSTYVALPHPSSPDHTVCKPVTISSAAPPRQSKSLRFSSPLAVSRSPSVTRALSATPEHSYDQISDGFPHREKKAKTNVKKKVTSGKPLIKTEEDEGSTCHQCRRKTTKEKMGCRNLRPDGTVCPMLFCKYCIEVRYDDIFDEFHCTWHCPRCRGICNCSICLRKAGFGYILDGSMSMELTGIQGRLSVASASTKRASAKAKGVSTGEPRRNVQRDRVSVREWLARQGIALGTQEWMEERRRQGVRFVVGKSPPPLDAPSPYKEAPLNRTLIARMEEDVEEDDTESDDNFPLDPRLKGEGGSPPKFVSGSRSNNIRGILPGPYVSRYDGERSPSAVHRQPDSELTVDLAPGARGTLAEKPLLPQTQDLPGLSPAHTRHMKLFIGQPLSRSKKRKRGPGTVKIQKQKVLKVKEDSDDGDLNVNASPTTALPAVRVRGRHLPDATTSTAVDQDDEKDDEKESVAEPSYPSGPVGPPVFADGPPSPPSPPPPPSEPVLVPTEYYTPSKLDGPSANDSQAHFGHSYWSLNAFNQDDRENEHEQARGSTPSPFTRTPLYSSIPPYRASLSPVHLPTGGPSSIGYRTASTGLGDNHSSRTESMSLSGAQPPNDYLGPRTHVRTHADGFTGSGLASFATLDETWTAIEMPPIPNMDMDVPPLSMEALHTH